ncbi:uncharacterized protein TRIADDRAFT_33826 [Trichoplax adhaerens]|uniref:Ubiquinone biosynthesis monooxygenase COQ6, mitochondrial n=1 Tax=Trichoplax adhaerens TaxID=10228 RepID=B3SDE9_TRIAD|nr:hypothetical protein TRIADDRAFT_33826 [Trichoplax adhaerens]EDV19260.1 hypothetical protein TRIADDRAFT_33826 [Trichoplax adhaerens]|eukprot:XP_002118257.1 hypothetical protein TRIADDRAFT_33826 [Trichoplax adhaerens]
MLRRIPTAVRVANWTRSLATVSNSGGDTVQKTSKFDIVIAGGGMVGSAMACSIGYNPIFGEYKIALLEPNPVKTMAIQADFSNRVSAIIPGSINVLDDIGVWPYISELRAKLFQSMQVWDAASDHSFLLLDSKFTDEKMGYVVENDVIMLALMKRLKLLDSNVEILHCKVDDISLQISNGDIGNVSIKLDNDDLIETRLLIGADGPQSSIRTAANIKHISLPYNQLAIVATLQLENQNENVVAWQRFLPDGPIALLPLSNSRSSLVWTTNPKHGKMLLEMSNEEFIDSVNNAFVNNDHVIPNINRISSTINRGLNSIPSGNFKEAPQSPPTVAGIDNNSRGGFPLSLGHATNYVMNRLALIGDAAHRVHPLAGQGVNLGFKDVEVLSKVLAEAVTEGNDIGALPHLLKYESTRQLQVLPIMATIDNLNRLFSNKNASLALARGIGFQFLNYLTPLKVICHVIPLY